MRSRHYSTTKRKTAANEYFAAAAQVVDVLETRARPASEGLLVTFPETVPIVLEGRRGYRWVAESGMPIYVWRQAVRNILAGGRYAVMKSVLGYL